MSNSEVPQLPFHKVSQIITSLEADIEEKNKISDAMGQNPVANPVYDEDVREDRESTPPLNVSSLELAVEQDIPRDYENVENPYKRNWDIEFQRQRDMTMGTLTNSENVTPHRSIDGIDEIGKEEQSGTRRNEHNFDTKHEQKMWRSSAFNATLDFDVQDNRNFTRRNSVEEKEKEKHKKRSNGILGGLIAVCVVLFLVLAGFIAFIVLMVQEPCKETTCGHGVCEPSGQKILAEPICICQPGWKGTYCDTESTFIISSAGTSLNISWDAGLLTDTDLGWRLTVEEAHEYLEETSFYTKETSVTVENVKPLTSYSIEINGVHRNGTLELISKETKKLGRQESLDIILSPSNYGRGVLSSVVYAEYYISVERVEKAFTLETILSRDTTSVILKKLHHCTDYSFILGAVRMDNTEKVEIASKASTDCETHGWSLGDSVIMNEWSGGATPILSPTHCDQPDNFSWPVQSPSCPDDEATGRVGEAVTDADSHSGLYSWHYKRGHSKTSHGAGCPFSPQLTKISGRTDGAHIGDADGFYIRLWIKAANESGDFSSMEIAGGGPKGIDRESTMVYVTAMPTGLEFQTFDCPWEVCIPNKNCAATGVYYEVILAENLSLGEWHKLEMEFRAFPDDYADRWTYRIDDTFEKESGAYLTAWTFENYGIYDDYINRIKIKPRHDTKNATYQGFYFDDIYYEVFKWDDRNNKLDKYETSFEP